MSEKEKKYCHALVSCGLTSRKVYREVFEQGFSFEKLYHFILKSSYAPCSNRMKWGDIVIKLYSFDIEKEYKNLLKKDIKLLVHSEIPNSLRNIVDAPIYLYAKGDILTPFKFPLAAIVGSRNMTAYSKDVIDEIVDILVSKGYSIVSGLANGVDSYAHRRSIKHTKAIAVLGTGITECYPESNRDLYEDIISNGLVLSEYPPRFKVDKYTFAARNRIISGLSDIVIIIQASKKSGSLITAISGLEQGKDIYVLPGLLKDESFEGSNNLIRDGAYIISDLKTFSDDINLRLF